MSIAVDFRAMAKPDLDQKRWLEDLLHRLGLTATELARRAELNPSTLTRFLNDASERGHTLTFRSVRKIEQAVARLENQPVRRSSTGFSETEGTPYDAETFKDGLAHAVAALTSGRNAVDAWKVGTGALCDLGIDPGDVLIVDMNEPPRSGDIVCAQVYDLPLGGARTVFRLWEPPYLLSGSLEPGRRKPILVDDEKAVIRGVVVSTLSPRQNVAFASRPDAA